MNAHFLRANAQQRVTIRQDTEQYRYGKSQQGHDGGVLRMAMSGTGCDDGDNSQCKCGSYQYQMKQTFDGGFSHD